MVLHGCAGLRRGLLACFRSDLCRGFLRNLRSLIGLPKHLLGNVRERAHGILAALENAFIELGTHRNLIRLRWLERKGLDGLLFIASENGGDLGRSLGLGHVESGSPLAVGDGWIGAARDQQLDHGLVVGHDCALQRRAVVFPAVYLQRIEIEEHSQPVDVAVRGSRHDVLRRQGAEDYRHLCVGLLAPTLGARRAARIVGHHLIEALLGVVQRRPAFAGPDMDIRAVLDQQAGHPRSAVGRRHVQRGQALIAGDVDVDAPAQKKLHGAPMTLPSGLVDSAETLHVARVDIGALLDQVFDHAKIAARRGQEQGRVVIVAATVHIRAVLH